MSNTSDTAQMSPSPSGPSSSPPSSSISSSSTQPSGGSGNGVPWQILTFVAIALIVVYVLVDAILLARANDAGTGENVWNRYVLLLKGFEALTFTAVGWLFGREINRGAAEKAEKATQQVEDAKVEAASEKTKGQTLAHAVSTSVDAAPRAEAGASSGGYAASSAQAAGESQMSSLKSLAERLYPDLG